MSLGSTSSSSTRGTSSGSSGSSFGGSILKRTRPLVSVFSDSASSYSSRATKYTPNNPSIHTFKAHGEHDSRSDKDGRSNGHSNAKRTPKIFTNIKKSFAGVRRWPLPSPSSATHSDLSSTHGHHHSSNTRVLYSTPAERLSSQVPETNSYTPVSTSPPTVAQIAMGLHTSRTPHSRSIRHPQPPGLNKRHTSPTVQPARSALKSSSASMIDREQGSSSRLFSTHSNLSSHTTLSTPNSSILPHASGSGPNSLSKVKGQKEGFFAKSKKKRGPFRHNSVASHASSTSRKTVRFDDTASA